MTLKNGINVSRRIGAGGGSNIGEELRQTRTSGNPPLFQIAVVVDVIYDPNLLTREDKTILAQGVANPNFVSLMPKNSILARIISNGHDLGDPTPRIIFPFFQSHLELPIKAGEQVFIVYPDPQTDGNQLGYWITRVPEPASVEDLNFTHGDRKFDPTLNSENRSTSQRVSSAEPLLPGFPNGGGTPESITLFISGSNTDPHNNIFVTSIANKQVTFEAVPRYTKRPGEFAIQGSNNARIVIGEDRTGPATRVSQSNQKSDKVGKAGTIDLVAGVGSPRFMPINKDDDPTITNAQKRPTSPHVIENSRRFKEIDKVPFKRNKKDNIKEGDPDFKRDLSRVYVSMKTAGDKNFDIKKKNLISDGKLITDLTDLPDGDEDGQPFIVQKSEHVRIIATGKDKADLGGPGEHGDIRIVKEGNESDKDLGIIILNKDGEIISVGKNIQLLTHNDGKIFLQTKETSEPYIKYTEFVNVVNGLHDQITDLKTAIQSICQAVQAAAPASICVPMSPDPAFTALLTQIASVIPRLNSSINPHKQSTDKAKDNAKSTKIFGK